MSVSRLLLSFVVIALPFGMAPAVAQPADVPATSPKKPSKGEQQALKWFSMLDANQDGRISRDEAKVAFRLSPSLAEYFRNADLNGDGVMEVVVRSSFWESIGAGLYSFVDSRLVVVEQTGCGI